MALLSKKPRPRLKPSPVWIVTHLVTLDTFHGDKSLVLLAEVGVRSLRISARA